MMENKVSGCTEKKSFSIDNSEDFMATTKGLLDLPAELRDYIYSFVVAKTTNTITMLFDYRCYLDEISASQPALSRVNKQLRHETLATFYASNTFNAQLDNAADLATAKRWLRAIGDANVRNLRKLCLCGWTRVPFGHMVSRRWVKVILDLGSGGLEMEGGDGFSSAHPEVVRRVDELKGSFRELVKAREGVGFDVGSVAGLMDGFSGMCTGY